MVDITSQGGNYKLHRTGMKLSPFDPQLLPTFMLRFLTLHLHLPYNPYFTLRTDFSIEIEQHGLSF